MLSNDTQSNMINKSECERGSFTRKFYKLCYRGKLKVTIFFVVVDFEFIIDVTIKKIKFIKD